MLLVKEQISTYSPAKRSNLGLTKRLDPAAHLRELGKTEGIANCPIVYSQQSPDGGSSTGQIPKEAVRKRKERENLQNVIDLKDMSNLQMRNVYCTQHLGVKKLP